MMKKILPTKIKVRIPPSPTGPLHIGTARTALYNYLFAKQNKGKLILRIEDTDKERSQQRFTDEIISELKWLGIEWSEGPDIDGKFGPYKQSQRGDIYKKYLQKLLDEDRAYYCFCSSEELESSRQEQMSRGLAPKYKGTCAHLSKETTKLNLLSMKPSVIRFRVENKKVKFTDMVRGQVEFDMNLLGDVVLAKDLETPLYHFAVVVDDFLMEITHVIRGEDHISNTPRQILIQEALGFYTPEYGHLPLLLNADRSKLSKRNGDVSVSDYHKQGYLPEALINFMVLLGWNPGTEKEIFTLAQLTKEFSLEKVQKAGAVFNIQKLDFINSYYIKQKPIKTLTELCMPYLEEFGRGAGNSQMSESTYQKIVEVSRQRMKKLSDIVELSDFFFKDILDYDANMLQWNKAGEGNTKEALELVVKIIEEMKKWDVKMLEKKLLEVSLDFNKQKGYPEKNRGYVLWPLRAALSGKQSSPSPFEIAEILGKDETLKRIAQAIKVFG